MDKNQLKLMTTEYNKTIHQLNKLVKMVENILTMAQICRKYETQNEKVIPFKSKTLDWTHEVYF